MNPLLQTALVGFGSALLAYFGTRRLNSGSVRSSDATILWSTMTQELTQLRKRVADQQEEIDKLWQRVRLNENSK